LILSVIIVSSCISGQANTESHDIATEKNGSQIKTPAPSSTYSPSEPIPPTIQNTITPTTYPTATLTGEDRIFIDCERTIYNVIKGDTLTSVSESFNVPIDEIKNFNGLVDDVIYDGQTLYLPLCDWDYVYELLEKEE